MTMEWCGKVSVPLPDFKDLDGIGVDEHKLM